MARLLYQGHGSYRITANDGTVIYIDPYAGGGYDIPADIILVTHEHFDHNVVNKMPHAPGFRIIRNKDALKGGVYGFFEIGSIMIQAVQAYNRNHPKNECVGFVLSLDGVKVYAAGDTSETEDMHSLLPNLKLDYALLPGDGIFNMNVEEASRCAELIGARHSIPIHLNPSGLYSEKLASRFHCTGKLLVRPGEVLSLEPERKD